MISLLALGIPRRRLRDAVRAARCLDETEVDRRFLDRRIFDTTPVHQLHLPLHNGKTFCLEHIDGHAMLQILVSEVPTASTMFKERLAVKPLPWTLILAADEGWCGNNLSVSGRKVQIWSYSFLELGPENLALSCAWLTPMLMRSTIQGKTIGGCSAVSALLLQHLLLSPESGFASVGCPLKVGLEQQPVVLTANNVVRVVADGEGHRQFSQIKGGSGLRICSVCANVWSVKSNMAGALPGYVSQACADSAMFKPNAHMSTTVDKLLKMADDYERGTVSKATFEDHAKANGIEPTAGGLLSVQSLRPYVSITGSLTYDWPHIVLQDGVFSVEVSLLLASVEVSRKQWEDHIASFSLSSYHRGFQSKMVNKIGIIIENKKIGGINRPSNSEVLDYVVVFRSLFVAVGLSDDNPEFESFSALVDVILALVKISRAGFIDDDAVLHRFARDLQELSQRFMALHVRNYGEPHTKPKHHWLLHIWKQLLRDRCVLNSFVVERLVRRTRTTCKNLCCTKRFEKSGAQSIFVRSLHHECGDSCERMLGRIIPSRSGIPTTLRATNEFDVRISSGDVVLAGGHFAEVQFFIKKGEEPIVAMLELYNVVSVRQIGSVVRPAGVRKTFRLGNLAPAIAWLRLPDGDLAVVHVDIPGRVV